jgi:hypothetical protein
MTFFEAALRVLLEREGKPLHVNAIVEQALKENLLSPRRQCRRRR